MKIFWSLLTALLITTSLQALPLGNPWEASLHSCGVLCLDPSHCRHWNVRLGYYGDFNWDRHLRVEKHGELHRTRIHTNAAYLALNICNRVDLFTTLGATKATLIAAQGRQFGNAQGTFGFSNFRVFTDSAFSWSLGARGTLWQYKCLGIGIEGQYFSTRPLLNALTIDQVSSFYYSGNHFKYREWQIGFGVSYRVPIGGCGTALLPYAGARWNPCRVDMDDVTLITPTDIFGTGFTTLFDLHNKRDWGWSIGLTLLGCSKASITVEGRFVNEKALYVNGQVCF